MRRSDGGTPARERDARLVRRRRGRTVRRGRPELPLPVQDHKRRESRPALASRNARQCKCSHRAVRRVLSVPCRRRAAVRGRQLGSGSRSLGSPLVHRGSNSQRARGVAGRLAPQRAIRRRARDAGRQQLERRRALPCHRVRAAAHRDVLRAEHDDAAPQRVVVAACIRRQLASRRQRGPHRRARRHGRDAVVAGAHGCPRKWPRP
mmetsp:Transcript_6852/g.21474  ORF Transcript_6852/g.21474 Transcript_6852/m.21474 type:complete len:206 (-) Transcript_6852:403-1020(-)